MGILTIVGALGMTLFFSFMFAGSLFTSYYIYDEVGDIKEGKCDDWYCLLYDEYFVNETEYLERYDINCTEIIQGENVR